MATIGKVRRTTSTICEFKWSISEFVSLPKEADKSYVSPFFSFAGATWYIRIYPNGFSSHSYLGYICLNFSRTCCIPPISLDVSFSLKTVDGKKYLETNCTEHVIKDGWERYGIDRYLLKSELLERKSELLPSNILTIFCTVKHLKSNAGASDNETANCSHCKEIVDAKDISSHEKKCVNKPIKCPECSQVVALRIWYEHECQAAIAKGEPCTSGLPVVLHEKKLLLDFKELFLNKEDCDVIIKVKGEEFPAHKPILKARSSVFKSTFRTDMKEKATGVVEIDDCDPSCFSNFLCFIYCGDEGVISKENIFSLFTVADKYDVQDLREKCLEFMTENLTVDTFCDIITVALQHSETDLVKLATDFFIKNAAKIVVTVKWQLFSAENPTQSNELIVKLLVPDASRSK